METLQITAVLLFHLSSVVEVKCYALKCPIHAEWNITAVGKCNNQTIYFCLYDNINERYREGCEGPDFDRIGSKRIIAGHFTRGKCKEDRFQPFDFWTNGSSDCAYEKSLCNERGQILHSNGSAQDDRTCSCDYANGYAFVNEPKMTVFCIPFAEDCTCYLKECQQNYKLSKDFKCEPVSDSTDIYTHIFIHDVSTRPPSPEKGDIRSILFDELNGPDNAAAGTIILFLITCVVLVLVALLMYKRHRKSKSGHEEEQDDLVDLLQDVSTQLEAIVQEPISSDDHNFSNTLGIVDEEQLNYLRIIHLLFRVACPVVRMKFNIQFHPDQLQKTLYKNKKILEDQLRRKNKINSDQWNLLYPKKGNASSKDFDIRLMILLIGTLTDMQIGEIRPLVTDRRPVADLTRIKFIRNTATQSINGKISNTDFLRYWTDISQAVLRLVSPEFPQLASSKEEEHKTLAEKILSLNPLQFNSKSLYTCIVLVEKCYPFVLRRIIQDYCELKHVSVEQLLNDEKHELFHLRNKTRACCLCLKPIIRTLSENVWEQLYDTAGITKRHTACPSAKDCSLYFVAKSGLNINNFNSIDSVGIILHIPNLLIFVAKKFGFRKFLKKHQHVIYHSVFEKKCCKCQSFQTKCKVMISEEEFGQLFVRKLCIRCKAGTMCDNHTCCCNFVKKHCIRCNKGTVCDNDTCCCKYKVKTLAKCLSAGKNLLTRIFKIVGPFQYFGSVNDDIVTYISNEEKLRGIVQETKKVLNELMAILSDNHTEVAPSLTMNGLKEECNKKDARPLCLDSVNEATMQDSIIEWILTNIPQKKSEAAAGPVTSVLVKDKDGWILKGIPGCKESGDSIMQKKRNESISNEEENFLRLVNLLMSVVSHAVRKKFNAECPSNELNNILIELYEKMIKSKETKKKIYNSKQETEQIEEIKQPEPEKMEDKSKLKLEKKEVNSKPVSENNKVNNKTESHKNDEDTEVTKLLKHVYFTQQQKEKLFPSSGQPSSDSFDLKLMICILELREKVRQIKISHEISSTLLNDLDSINTIRREMMQSPSGLLSDDKFNEYWRKLTEAAIRMGGEEFKKEIPQQKNPSLSTSKQ